MRSAMTPNSTLGINMAAFEVPTVECTTCGIKLHESPSFSDVGHKQSKA